MVLKNEVLYAAQYAEMLSGRYPLRCDTVDEVIEYLRSSGNAVGRGAALIDVPAALKETSKNYVFVEFSLPEDYTKHEIRLMTVPKKCLSRAKKYEQGITLGTHSTGSFCLCHRCV